MYVPAPAVVLPVGIPTDLHACVCVHRIVSRLVVCTCTHMNRAPEFIENKKAGQIFHACIHTYVGFLLAFPYHAVDSG